MMAEEADGIVTVGQLEDAEKNRSSLVLRTPLMSNAEHFFPEMKDNAVKLHLKLETMQITGSFKFRGVMNQVRFLPPEVKSGKKKPITMSAGNYGKAFGHVMQLMGLSGICLLPETAPSNRVSVIQSYGVETILIPTPELQLTVDKYVLEEGCTYLHAFDDINLIAGYSSIGTEILEDVPDPDVVVICCGGGGLISGASVLIKSKCPNCRIYGVEPEGAPTMYESFKAGYAVSIPTVKTIASGLAPPFAGKITYEHCRKYVDDILLVSDNDIKQTVQKLYRAGLVVETSGSAAMAALLSGKVPDVTGKQVVVVLTGSNVTPDEMAKLFN